MCLCIWHASGEQLACWGLLMCGCVQGPVCVYADLFDTLYECLGKDAIDCGCVCVCLTIFSINIKGKMLPGWVCVYV